MCSRCAIHFNVMMRSLLRHNAIFNFYDHLYYIAIT